MPASVYRYTPGRLIKLTYRETDDSPTILAKLNPPESVDDQKKSDEDQSNCELSDDVWAYIARQPNTRMKWVRAARTHCAALSVCEDGFPGYSRREILVRRAMRRATTVIRYPIETETIVLKELILGSIDELGRRLKTAAEIVVTEQYIAIDPANKPTLAEAFAMVSALVIDDNYIYESYDPHGQTRQGPFRNRAVGMVFSKAFFGDSTRDLYNFHVYFYPVMPHFLIVLICTALRCALDELWTGEQVPREFSRDLYGEVLSSLSFRWASLEPEYARSTQIELSTRLHDIINTGPTPSDDGSSDADEEDATLSEAPPLKRPKFLF